MQRSDALDEVDVCNAALMEVGLPPTAYRNSRGKPVVKGPRSVTRRAVALSLLAAKGIDARMICQHCLEMDVGQRVSSFGRGSCIDAIDVLRGRTSCATPLSIESKETA